MAHDPEPVMGRYRFVRRLPAGGRSVVWLAEDTQTGREVVASLLPATRATGLEPIVGMSHPHMAQVLEVVAEWDPRELPGGEAIHPEGSIVLAEHITGRSLHQRAQVGPFDVDKAVQWIERCADVVATVHRLGGVHGAISPRAILVAQTTHGVAPVLTHLLTAPAGAYCSPERVTGGGPSEADDVWALAAILYLGLTGKPPFSGADRKELARAIVAASPPAPVGVDESLVELLGRALRRSLTSRLTRAEALHEELIAWLDANDVEQRESIVTIVPPGDPSAPPSLVDDRAMQDAVYRPDAPESAMPTSDAPGPLVPAASAQGADETADPLPTFEAEAPPLSTRQPAAEVEEAAGTASVGPTGADEAQPEDPERTRPAPPPSTNAATDERGGNMGKVLILALGAAFGLIAYFTLTRGGGGTEPLSAESPAARATTIPSPPGKADAAADAQTATDGAAVGDGPSRPTTGQDATACLVASMPEGTFGRNPDLEYLCTERDFWYIARKTLAIISKRGQGEGMQEWVHLTEYELPTVALLRRRCCAEASTATAATPKTVCASLTDALHTIAEAPKAEAIDHFDEVFECLSGRQVRYPPAWDRVPKARAREAFEGLLRRWHPVD
jgi:hypothetical protein